MSYIELKDLQIIARESVACLLKELEGIAVFCSAKDGDIGNTNTNKIVLARLPLENFKEAGIEKYSRAVIKPIIRTLAYEFQEMRKRIIKTFRSEPVIVPALQYIISIDGLNIHFCNETIPETNEDFVSIRILV